MSKEKQIEEMAQDFRKCHEKSSFGGYDGEIAYTDYDDMANRMFQKGWRKQSEGEWIVTDADSGSFGEYEPFIEFKCSKCEAVYGIESGQYDWQYGDSIPWVACPLCGAKMKGGVDE